VNCAPTEVLTALDTRGEALDATLRMLMERRHGADFSRIRVHRDAAAAEAAHALHAQAFTVGNHIVEGATPFSPDS